MDKHRVDEDATKRLPNRLMNGGTYRAWLRANDLDEGCEKVKAMVDMQMEMGKLRPAVFAHERHRAYAESERSRIKKSGGKQTDAEVDRAVFSSIVQRAERQMVLTAAKAFFDAGWDILALIHDGFNAEPSPDADSPLSLEDALAKAKEACRAISGLKYVEFKDKPLHGLQDETPKTIANAQTAMDEFESMQAANA